jgi:RND family efflux transporter MFP subunit
MTKGLKIAVPGVILLAIIAIFVYRAIGQAESGKGRKPMTPAVKISIPTRETITQTLQFTGDVQAIQQASIFSKVSGNLEQVYVNMGTSVRQNQLLALIDTTELYQQYQQSNATFQNAKLAFARTQELFGKSLISKQELDNSQAALTIAQAAAENSGTRLNYARITAPFSGVITRRFLDPGAAVTPNNVTLYTLMDLDSVKVIINVLEKHIPKIAKGTKATIAVDAFPDKKFTGTITRYSDAVDPATRTMAVELDIPNNDHLLKPGMFANVILALGEQPNIVTVPTQAVLKDASGYYLFTVFADTAHKQRVTTGAEQNTRTAILAGVSDSDKVIIAGQQFARDGGPVSIQR